MPERERMELESKSTTNDDQKVYKQDGWDEEKREDVRAVLGVEPGTEEDAVLRGASLSSDAQSEADVRRTPSVWTVSESVNGDDGQRRMSKNGLSCVDVGNAGLLDVETTRLWLFL